MHPILRNSLSVLAGLVVGNVINMGIVMISGSIIPPPEGADVTTAEGLQASIHLFEAKHYIFPFLAHALGTLSGALVAALIGTQTWGRCQQVIQLMVKHVVRYSMPHKDGT